MKNWKTSPITIIHIILIIRLQKMIHFCQILTLNMSLIVKTMKMNFITTRNIEMTTIMILDPNIGKISTHIIGMRKINIMVITM